MQGATPLLFSIFVSKSSSVESARLGSAGDPWYGHLIIEPVDEARMPALRWSLLGRPRSVYVRHDARENLTSLEMYDGAEAVFDDVRKIYTAEFGVAPEDVARLPQGRHAYRAVLVSDSWLPWQWRGRVASAPISVTIETPVPNASSEIDAARVADSSRFYFRVGRFDDALRSAQSLVQATPGNAEYHILQGDALNGLRRDNDAYNEYREALLLLSAEKQQGHHDAPEYLFMRMAEMRNRIAQAQPAKK